MSRKHRPILFVITGIVLIWSAVAATTGWPAPIVDAVEEHAPPPTEAPPGTLPARASAPETSFATASDDIAAARQVEPTAPGADTQTQVPAPQRVGPVAELAERYASEPRASSSAHLEATIEAQFRRDEVPAGLLRSAMCRTSVCRVETHWSPARAQGFMFALMQLATQPAQDQGHFDSHIAVSPDDAAAADGSRMIEVYLPIVRNAP